MELPNQSKDIILKEYGRNIQDIVAFILKIEDREQRTKYAITCIELMRMINPTIKDTQELYTKLWDQLYIISNFELDVDSPHPMPERAAIGKKPTPVAYNSNKLFYKHYGRNIELVIQKAIDMEDPEEKEAIIIYLGRTMKKFYCTWNKENVEDDLIITHIHELSRGKLVVDVEKVKAQSLFDTNERIKPQGGANSSGNNYSNNGNGGASGYGTLYEGKSNSISAGGSGGNRFRQSSGSSGAPSGNKNRPSGGSSNNNNNRFKRK